MAQYEPLIQVLCVTCYTTWPSCNVSISQGAKWHPHGHAMCYPTLGVLKNVKFRLSQNPTKFDGVTRFREMNSTVKSVCHPKSTKFPAFHRNYGFTRFFFKKIDFSWVLHSSPLTEFRPRNSHILAHTNTCICLILDHAHSSSNRKG